MMRVWITRHFVLRLLLCLALLNPAWAAERMVTVVHVNDVYQIAPIDPKAGKGGLARLGGLLAALRQEAKELVFTFGGDTLSPGVESGLFQGKPMMEAWNALGVDWAVLGNHEFDMGETVLRQRLAESRFPWLTANVRLTPPLPPLPAVSGSALRVVNGVKLGVVGLITPETATLSKPGPNVAFDALLPAARREVAALRAAGAEVVVALTHCTLEEDRALAASGLFAVILGGHDHHMVAEQIGQTLLFKAGSDARDALHLRLHFESDGGGNRLARQAWDWLPVDARWPEAPALAALAADYAARTQAKLGAVVAETTVALEARGEALRRGETNIANFTADAVRQAMGSDFVLLNGGGFRADRLIGPGPLTLHDVEALLPFRNPLIVLAITGSQLRTVLEHGLDRRVSRGQSGAMPQVSGLRLRYDPQRPAGARLVSLTRADGQPVEDSAVYTLTTSNYLASGGDDYPVLKTLPVRRPAEGSPIETDVLREALQRAGQIAPVTDGRLEALP